MGGLRIRLATVAAALAGVLAGAAPAAVAQERTALPQMQVIAPPAPAARDGRPPPPRLRDPGS